MEFTKSQLLNEKFHATIPGGSHTYAKGDDQYPESARPYIVRGKGCHIWDVDGNEFIEYGMGVRSVSLGHAYNSVVDAAHKQMLKGNNFIRPATIELECAEKMLGLIDGAEMVKFGKNGSDETFHKLIYTLPQTGRNKVIVAHGGQFGYVKAFGWEKFMLEESGVLIIKHESENKIIPVTRATLQELVFGLGPSLVAPPPLH